jgi:hypothetical protein
MQVRIFISEDSTVIKVERKVTFGAFSFLIFIEEKRFCCSEVTVWRGDTF